MAYLNESHIEFTYIDFFVNQLGYYHIDGVENQLPERRSPKTQY